MKKLYLTILIIFGIANLSFADTQLWYPDTCNGCAFEVDKATFELVEVKAPDPAHPELSGKQGYLKKHQAGSLSFPQTCLIGNLS